jgi:hypothetical protein
MTKLKLIKPKTTDQWNVLGFKQITILETFNQVTGRGKNRQSRSYFLAQTEHGLTILAWDDLAECSDFYKADTN